RRLRLTHLMELEVAWPCQMEKMLLAGNKRERVFTSLWTNTVLMLMDTALSTTQRTGLQPVMSTLEVRLAWLSGQ
ncbi:hypothetical protein RE94_26815, partial [Klebsiella pneumoniae]